MPTAYTPDCSVHHIRAGGPLLDGQSMQDAGLKDQPWQNDSRRKNVDEMMKWELRCGDGYNTTLTVPCLLGMQGAV